MTKAYALLPEEYFFDREKLIIAEDLDDDLLIKIKRHEAWWKKPYKEYWGYPEKGKKDFPRTESQVGIGDAYC